MTHSFRESCAFLLFVLGIVSLEREDNDDYDRLALWLVPRSSQYAALILGLVKLKSFRS
jgi:hypothetical protein